jgi:lipopolysaccharide transport system permease protein
MVSVSTTPAPRARAGAGAASPFAMFRSAWQGRRLILRLASREIQARYRGSLLGMAWLVLLPLLMLGVYTFAFSIVFRARWGDLQTSTAAFALIMFAGLTVYSLFAESVNRAPSLILENPAYVKKVLFPLELLPWVTLLVSGFNVVVNFVVLALFYPFVFGMPPVTALLVPLELAPVALVTLGFSWFLASIGVFMRDVRPIVSVMTTAIMFLSPIFYPMSAIPENLRPYLALNPLAHTLEQVRASLIFGQAPSPVALGVQILIGWAVAWLGYLWFAKTRKAFADVL